MSGENETVVDIKKQIENSFERGEGMLHINDKMSDNETLFLLKGCMKMSKGKPFKVVTVTTA